MKAGALSRLAADADRCVRCGLCIPLCPTWQVTRNEGLSPRGRIVAMAELAAGRNPAGAARLLDSCLGCGLCEAACPSRVPYLRMLGPGKQASGGRRRPAAAALIRLAGTAGGDRILEMLLGAARIAVRLGGPRRLRRLARILPRPNRGGRFEAPAAAAPEGPPVVLFRGCCGNSLDRGGQDAAGRLLAACGYRIVRKRRAGCCGFLPEHAGLTGRARRAAARNRRILAPATTIATTASGCAAGLAAQNPAAAPVDACDLVQARLDRLPPARPARPQRIILHVPCSSQPGGGGAGLLRAIPGAELIETGAGQCCGAGGLTWLSHPRQGAELADRVAAEMIAAADANTAFAGPNHPCARHLERALARQGCSLPIRHPLEVFGQSWFAPARRAGRLP